MRKAYKKFAKKFHPDRAGLTEPEKREAHEKFVLLQSHYELLLKHYKKIEYLNLDEYP